MANNKYPPEVWDRAIRLVSRPRVRVSVAVESDLLDR
jgi:hypothetical protein